MTLNTQSNYIKDRLFALIQLFIPHHFLSGIMYKITRIETVWFKDFIIKKIIDIYNVDMSQAENENIANFKSFNDFFTRPLKANARPIAEGAHCIISPVDGTVSEVGKINNDQIFQAKGISYSLEALVGGSPERAEFYRNGYFATLYLSPRDYHRIHMPLSGRLREMVHVPGRLFSVSPSTTRSVAGLFARNERVIAGFSTDAGPMAMILVGAIFVSSMETVWAGTITPPRGKHLRQWSYDTQEPICLDRAEEMGRFNMGSTVILLFPENSIEWEQNLVAGKKIQFGEKIGEVANQKIAS